MRDQTAALYKWEDGWSSWNASTVSLAECRKFIRMACEAYNAPVPAVTMHKHTELSYYHTETNRISLRHDQKNIPIALHEASHAITWHLYKDTVQDHGPEFLGVYIYLLTQSGSAPQVAIEASARAAGLRWKRNSTPRDLVQPT